MDLGLPSSLSLGSEPGAWVFLRDATARFVPALSLLAPQPLIRIPKNTVLASVIRTVHPIRSLLLVKLEQMVVLDLFHEVVPQPRTARKWELSPDWLLGALKWGVMLVATEEPSTLFPCWQDRLTPGCSSADPVFRPSSSAFLFINARQETALWEEPAEPPPRVMATCSWVTLWIERGTPSLSWCPFGGQVYGEKDHFHFCDLFWDFKRKRLIKIACSKS